MAEVTVVVEEDKDLEAERGVALDKKMYQCGLCGKIFRHAGTFKKHSASFHIQEKRFKCEICGRAFVQSNHRNTHRLTVHFKEKSFVCDICGNSFGASRTLKRHQEFVHSEEEHVIPKFKCEFCGKMFRTSYLNTHQRTVHFEEKQFKCELCGRAFSRSCHLKSHVQSKHKKEFKCENCGKTFAQSSTLEKHYPCGEICKHLSREQPQNLQHKKDTEKLPSAPNVVELQQTRKRKRLKCNVCGRKFIRSCHLERHKQTAHDREQNDKCDESLSDDRRQQQIPREPRKASYFRASDADDNIHDKNTMKNTEGEHYTQQKSSEGIDVNELLKVEIADETKEDFDFSKKEMELEEQVDLATAELKEERIEWDDFESGETLLYSVKQDSPEYDVKQFDNKKEEVQLEEAVENNVREEQGPETEESQKEKFTCVHCGKCYPKICILKRHLRTVHTHVANVACDICGSSVKMSGLRDHKRRIHFQSKRLRCETCGKGFKDNSRLEQHQKTVHLNEKSHICMECGKRFVSSNNLKTHAKTIHEKERKFVCETCGKSFSQAVSLKIHHQSVHLQMKPYNCKICGKSFSNPGYLKIHHRTIHLLEKPFTCNICGKSFSQSSSLGLHERGVHFKEKKFKCVGCNKSFLHSGDFKKHQHTVHFHE